MNMLIDTSGLLCLYDHDSEHNQQAIRFYQAAAVRLTTNYVLAEFVALAYARKLSRQLALKISREMLLDQSIEIVWVDEPLHQQSLDLLQNRVDKTYSLCDAVSFVLMRERQINEALTTDKHFAQEGFVRLLAP